MWESNYSTSLPSLGVVNLFKLSKSGGCILVFNSLSLHPPMLNDVKHPFMFLLSFIYFLWWIIVQIFLIYFGQALLFIPEKIINKYIFKKEKEIPKMKNHNSPLIVKYIFNDLSDKLSYLDIIYIFGISLLTLLIDLVNFILLKIYNKDGKKIFYNEHFFLFELLFLFLISFFFYKIKYYKHQLYSIIIILILGFIQLLFKSNYYINLVNGIFRFILKLCFPRQNRFLGHCF